MNSIHILTCYILVKILLKSLSISWKCLIIWYHYIINLSLLYLIYIAIGYIVVSKGKNVSSFLGLSWTQCSTESNLYNIKSKIFPLWSIGQRQSQTFIIYRRSCASPWPFVHFHCTFSLSSVFGVSDSIIVFVTNRV